MNNYKALAAALPFDITAEALVGSLLESSEELAGVDQILVRPLGHINRVSGQEVMNMIDSVYNAKGQELLYIDINRESLFDSLPEMLFLHPESIYEDEVEKAQDLARQQETARRFFLPLEEVLNQARIEIELAERSTIKNLAKWLLPIYSLPDLRNNEEPPEQLLSLVLALPFLDRMVGNTSLTGQFLTAILRKTVKIMPGKPQQYTIPEAQQTCLGSGSLGIDFLLGDSFTDGIRSMQIRIGEVHPDELESWLPGGSQRTLLEEQLFPYVLPAGEQVTISLEITEAAGQFVLKEENQNLNILGYTTQL
jgi:hypothetical protein